MKTDEAAAIQDATTHLNSKIKGEPVIKNGSPF